MEFPAALPADVRDERFSIAYIGRTATVCLRLVPASTALPLLNTMDDGSEMADRSRIRFLALQSDETH